MYIQLQDSGGFKSTILYIHNDCDRYIKAIEKWHVYLHIWLNHLPEMEGLPIGRFEPNIAIIDLLQYLITNVYIAQDPLYKGHITGGLYLYSDEQHYEEEPINLIHLYDVDFFKNYKWLV